MTTISKLSTKIVDDLYNAYPNMFTGVNRSLYINAFQTAMTGVLSTDIELSKTEPDYERIMLQLIQALSEDPQWYDIIVSGTGHAIIRMIASGIAYDQFSIMRAFQEAFPNTASSDNSIFAATRMLGVRPRRKLPSRVSAKLERPDTGTYLEVPKFSSFDINGVKFFNREKVVFKPAMMAVSCYLFQGSVVEETLESTGEPFQRFMFGNGNRSASDADVIVTVNGQEWTKITDGPWSLERGSKTYYESTLSNGDIEIQFGNGDFGYIPDTSSAIIIKWVETLGKDGNIDASDLKITWEDMPSGITVTGVTVTNCEGGDSEVTASVYRKIAPNLRAANRRAVRRSDYKAIALEFAGVKDALFRGQAELAPNRRSMMNVVGVTLLTDTVWGSAQKLNFEREFQDKLGIFQLEFLWIDPTPVVTNVIADVYCRPDANLADIHSELVLGIQELFTPKLNLLGYSIYQTDVSDILNGRIASNPSEKLERDIGYVILDPSMVDTIMPTKTHYPKLGNVDIRMHYTTRDGYSGRLDLSPTSIVS